MIVGLILGFGSLLAGMVLEGSTIGSYMVVSAAIIVFGGTAGATIAATGVNNFKAAMGEIKRAMSHKAPDRLETVKSLVTFAEKARKEGLLVLEDDLSRERNEFLRKGVQLVVDGTDPELVREILETESDAAMAERLRYADVWSQMSGFSPTLGIIGTVMGLVLVLGNLSDAQSLGPAIAVAFVATFYGVSFANLVYLPMGNRLKDCARIDSDAEGLMIEGILAIQAGDNPRIVEEKLVAFLEVAEKARLFAERAAKQEDQDLDMDLAA